MPVGVQGQKSTFVERKTGGPAAQPGDSPVKTGIRRWIPAHHQEAFVENIENKTPA